MMIPIFFEISSFFYFAYEKAFGHFTTDQILQALCLGILTM